MQRLITRKGKLIFKRNYSYSPGGYKAAVYDYDKKNKLKSVKKYDINGNVSNETKYFYFFNKPGLKQG